MTESIFQFKKFLIVILILQFIAVVAGVIMKVSHTAGANEVLIIGMSMTLLSFLIIVYDILVSPVSHGAIWIFGMFVAPLVVGLLYVFLRDDMFNLNLSNKSRTKVTTLATILACLSFSIVVLGTLFKVMKWPYANQMLIAGMILVIVGLIVGVVMKPKEINYGNSDLSQL